MLTNGLAIISQDIDGTDSILDEFDQIKVVNNIYSFESTGR